MLLSLTKYPLALILLALLSGCANWLRTTAMVGNLFLRQIVFTIAPSRSRSNQPSNAVNSASTISHHPESTGITISKIIKLHKLKKIAQWPIKTLGVEAIVAEFKGNREIAEVIAALQKDQRVKSVHPVQTYDLLTYDDPYFYLQSPLTSQGLAKVHEITTGKEVLVAIIDTGVDRRHPELAQQIIYSENFVASLTPMILITINTARVSPA